MDELTREAMACKRSHYMCVRSQGRTRRRAAWMSAFLLVCTNRTSHMVAPLLVELYFAEDSHEVSETLEACPITALL